MKLNNVSDSCWNISNENGFLINPKPLPALTDSEHSICILKKSEIDEIEEIASSMPKLLSSGEIRSRLDKLPVFSLNLDVDSVSIAFDSRVIERLMLIYSYFANAYVHATSEAATIIPKGVSIPLHKLSTFLDRPPILSYCSYVLNNWKLIDNEKPFALDNLKVIQNFLGGKDEEWFILVHVKIEHDAALAIKNIFQAEQAMDDGDNEMLLESFNNIRDSMSEMIKTFQRMDENCSPELYYEKVRPYIFSFTDVVYEGVDEFNNSKKSFCGQTGAQTSTIPMIVAILGIHHEETSFTKYLDIMKMHMPIPHRNVINRIRKTETRRYLKNHGNAQLYSSFNECVSKLGEFRILHIEYAKTFIFNKVANPVGTGGTTYMEWLSKLKNETNNQLLEA